MLGRYKKSALNNTLKKSDLIGILHLPKMTFSTDSLSAQIGREKGRKMGIWNRLFGETKQNGLQSNSEKKDALFLSFDPVETNINRLPDFYWAAVENIMAKGLEKDPITYANENLHVRCPKCSVDYNANGFQIGYLASLIEDAKRGTPITFTSGDRGIYPRCMKGTWGI